MKQNYFTNTGTSKRHSCPASIRRSSLCIGKDDIDVIDCAIQLNDILDEDENDYAIDNEANKETASTPRRSSDPVLRRRYSLRCTVNDDDRTRNNTTERKIQRRCSLFVDGQCIAKNDETVEISNEDLDVFENVFGDENIDNLEDNLPLDSVRKDCRQFIEAERHLSLTMNFDIESFSSSDGEKSHRASISFAKFISEKLDNAYVAQTQRSRIEQAAQVARTTPSLPFFTGNLAKYYMRMKDNLCNAMVKSEETRTVVGKMNKDVYIRTPRLRTYIKSKVLKRSRQHKHILRDDKYHPFK